MKKFIALAIALIVSSASYAEDKTIVEIAVGNKDFSTLVTAVKAAGLVETLSGPGPFTVLAPTNAAFEALKKKIGEEAFAAVLKDKEKLTAILTAHVIKGTVLAEAVVKADGKSVETLQGSTYLVSVDGKTVKIGGATVKVTDIKAKNGVIHVIDTVLLPNKK